jgi:serine/threonine protein phosphatase PrpC
MTRESAELSLHFEKLDCLSLPGNAEKPNEDSFGVTRNAVCVIDGATGLGEQLMPGPSDAQWIANFAARRFCAHAETGQGGIDDWLHAAAKEAETSFHALRRRPPRENYEIPHASAVMAALDGEWLNILWFGDCAVLLRNRGGDFALFGDTLSKRESERARVEKLSKAQSRHPAGRILREEFLPALRASRNRVNTGSEWLLAPDAACAAHAKSAQSDVGADSVLLLASDGFLALASDYQRYSPGALFDAAQEKGLQALGEELRAIETADPGGVQFPRFKTSDDATALLLRVCA